MIIIIIFDFYFFRSGIMIIFDFNFCVCIDFFIGINKPKNSLHCIYYVFDVKAKLICTKNSFKKYVVQMQSYGMREKGYKKKKVHNLAIVRYIY